MDREAERLHWCARKALAFSSGMLFFSTTSSLPSATGIVSRHLGSLPRSNNPGLIRFVTTATSERQLKVGTELQGRVTNLTDYGAFVDLGPFGSGLVHISEITAAYVRNIADHVSRGDLVQVRVIAIENGGRRISLSMKQCEHSRQATGYDRVVELGGDWGHPWNDDGSANFIDLGPRPKGPNAWEQDPAIFEPWVDPDKEQEPDTRANTRLSS